MVVNYINKYYNKEGKALFSSDDFNIDQEGIFSFEDALSEAYNHTIKGELEYCSTLTDGEPVTEKMHSRLIQLEAAYNIAKEIGLDANAYTIDDIEDTAADIMADKKQFGTSISR
jgi:hypothetical protein